MGLSCECGYDDYEWYYHVEAAWRLAQTDFKCYGCGKKGHAGDMVRRFTEEQNVEDEYGDEIDDPVITRYRRICEECGDLYDSLMELGFCLTADFNFIADAMEDYRENFTVRIL